jgi:AcrR family transcriptional regulator
VPRDATATRLRLRREAERLFARHGIWQVNLRDIVQAAGQRNASAVNYHFGSRDGLLRDILLVHGDPLDVERGELLAAEREVTARGLMLTLLVPLASRLTTTDGRNYLRIVAQLTGSFPVWRRDDDLNPPHLRRILTMLEEVPVGISRAVREERVVECIMLMTSAMAERARAVEHGRALALSDRAFVSNLADMLVGALMAPTGLPVTLVRSTQVPASSATTGANGTTSPAPTIM